MSQSTGEPNSFWRYPSAILLGVGGLFILLAGVSTGYVSLRGRELISDSNPYLPLYLSFAILSTVVGVMLCVAAVFEWRTPKSKWVVTALGLLLGLNIGNVAGFMILSADSPLWSLAPGFMNELIWTFLFSTLGSIFMFGVWFAVPIWHHWTLMKTRAETTGSGRTDLHR